MTNDVDTPQNHVIDCKNLEKFIIDFIDDALPEDTKLSFLQHIEECEHCNAYLQDYRKTITLSKATFAQERQAKEVGLPEELIDAILVASRKS